MELKSSRIILRDEVRKTDYEDYLKWWQDDEWQYYDEPDSEPSSHDRPEFEEWWKMQAKDLNGDHYRWQVDTIDGDHIGWVIFYGRNNEKNLVYIGIDIPEPHFWGKGYGSEALCLLIDFLFEELGFNEIRTATWSGNHRMIRCAEKCGFKEFYRGPHRAKFSIRGEPLERVEFSITKSKWNDIES